MRLNTEEQRRLSLIEWLAVQERGLQSVEPVYEGQARSFELSRDDVRHLEAQGLVTSYFAGGALPQAQITSNGRAWVEDIQGLRENKIERRWACRTGLVQWLDHVGADSETALKALDGFLSDVRSDFYGQAFTLEEMDAAAAWLQEKGLIDGVPIGERVGPASAHLTSRGLDCIERFGGDARQFGSATDQARVGDTTFNVNAVGPVQIATGPGATQHIEIQEAVAQNRLAVSGLVEILKAFGVSDAEELEPLYDDAVEALGGGEPKNEPLHRFAERAKSLAGKTGSVAATAAVSSLATAIVTNALHLLPSIH